MRKTTATLSTALAMTTAMTMIGFGSVAADDDNKKGPLSYSYIEGAYLHDNFNANGVVVRDDRLAEINLGTISDHSGGGGAVRVSFALPSKSKTIGFHIVSDYHQSSHSPLISITDGGGGPIAVGVVDTRQKELRLAVGMHTRSSDSVSWFAEVGLVRNKANLAEATGTFVGGGPVTTDLSFFSGSKTALDVKAGVRAMATKRLEMIGYGRWHGNGKVVSGDDGSLDFSGKFKAGTGAYYHFNDSFQLGGDYEFGRPGRLRLVARLSF